MTENPEKSALLSDECVARAKERWSERTLAVVENALKTAADCGKKGEWSYYNVAGTIVAIPKRICESTRLALAAALAEFTEDFPLRRGDVAETALDSRACALAVLHHYGCLDEDSWGGVIRTIEIAEGKGEPLSWNEVERALRSVTEGPIGDMETFMVSNKPCQFNPNAVRGAAGIIRRILGDDDVHLIDERSPGAIAGIILTRFPQADALPRPDLSAHEFLTGLIDFILYESS